MNRIFCLVLAVCLTLGGCARPPATLAGAETPAPSNATPEPTPAPDYTFRNTVWDMTKEEVIAAEGDKPYEYEDGVLTFKNVEFAGIEADVIYRFRRGRLVSGTYGISEQLSDTQSHIADFEGLKGLAAAKYGEPAIDEIRWDNKALRGKPELFDTAFILGHFSHWAEWETEDTRVVLVLTGVGLKVNLSLAYLWKEEPELSLSPDEI